MECRVLRDTTSIQRGIIRHVYLVIDLSLAMLVREHKSSWLDLTIQFACDFVGEFFDQNPISQMAILTTRDGSAERLSPLSGELFLYQCLCQRWILHFLCTR